MSLLELPMALDVRLRGRVLVMGIGNPLRGDDGVGCRVARLLLEAAESGGFTPPPGFAVLDTEEIPESFLGPAVAARPDTVLLVDAVDLGAPPGSAALLEVDDLSARTLLTHRTPLGPLAEFLRHHTGADIVLMAVQPASLEWGTGLGPDLAGAAESLAQLIRHALAMAPEARPC